MSDLLDYWVRTWIGDGDPTVFFRREMWNHFENFGPRTNNRLEGWHNGLKKNIGYKRPTLFQYMTGIKVKAMDKCVRVLKVFEQL